MSGNRHHEKIINPGPCRRDRGLSIIELVVAVAILLTLSAVAVPEILTAVHTSRLRGDANDFASLAQQDRIRSIQDDKFYSVHIAGSDAFVDLQGSGTYASGDPMTVFSSEVAVMSALDAPDTANLKSQFLPAGSALPVYDASSGSGDPPVTFSSHGLPCQTQTATGGSVCDSAGGATAFWAFFRDTVTGQMEAVTISPAGRIGTWYHGGSGWNSI